MPKATMVVGLGYGDEAKGSWTDFEVRRQNVHYVVRFNGGAQAAHHVVTSSGIEHTFAQFCSGTLVPGTFTCLSRFMLIEPQALIKEGEVLASKGVKDPLSLIIASENAPIISPFNLLLNRIQEVYRGGSRHGSCGLGIGLTQSDVEELGCKALYLGDFKDSNLVRQKLLYLGERKTSYAQRFLNEDTEELLNRLAYVDIELYVELYCSFYRKIRVVQESEFSEIIRNNDTIFEGAQGVLIDQNYGFFPHCTRSNCSFINAELLLSEAGFKGEIQKIGLLRGYMTRHGAGPFVTEDSSLNIPPCNNGTNPWQGEFRLGWFDAVAARYALSHVGTIDTLAITNLDRMTGLEYLKIATHYDNADTNFFTPEQIKTIPLTLEAHQKRTNSIGTIVPRYRKLRGFGTSEAQMLVYLDAISKEVDHKVSAYSASPTCDKRYI